MMIGNVAGPWGETYEDGIHLEDGLYNRIVLGFREGRTNDDNLDEYATFLRVSFPKGDMPREDTHYDKEGWISVQTYLPKEAISELTAWLCSHQDQEWRNQLAALLVGGNEEKLTKFLYHEHLKDLNLMPTEASSNDHNPAV